MKLHTFLASSLLLPLAYSLPSSSLSERQIVAPALSCLVENYPVGRDTMHPYSLHSRKTPGSAQTIKAWSAYSSVYHTRILYGLQVVWDSGDSPMAGRANGDEESFTFEAGEKIKTMEIAGGSAIDRITFITTSGLSFSAGGKGGTAKQMNVGNGLLDSFRGSHDSQDLYSIGPMFFTECQSCDCSLVASDPTKASGFCLSLCLKPS